MNLQRIGFYESEDITRILDEARRLELGETHKGTDPNGNPYRITRTEDGLEFETDEDVS